MRKISAPRAAADHRADRFSHRSQFFGSLRVRHFAKGNHALGEIDGDVADAFQIIGNLQRGDDQAHFVFGKRAAAQQPNGVLVNHDFHFVDARLEQENFTGKTGGAFALETDNGVESAIHRAFDETSHGDQIVDQRVVKNDFRQPRVAAIHASAASKLNTFARYD